MPLPIAAVDGAPADAPGPVLEAVVSGDALGPDGAPESEPEGEVEPQASIA